MKFTWRFPAFPIVFRLRLLQAKWTINQTVSLRCEVTDHADRPLPTRRGSNDLHGSLRSGRLGNTGRAELIAPLLRDQSAIGFAAGDLGFTFDFPIPVLLGSLCERCKYGGGSLVEGQLPCDLNWLIWCLFDRLPSFHCVHTNILLCAVWLRYMRM